MTRASLVIIAALAACTEPTIALAVSSDRRREPDPGPQHAGPCDPFESTERSIELAPPVVVARAEDGTIYAIDRVGALDMRAFIGVEGTLQRIRGGLVFESEDSRPGYLYALVRVPAGLLILRLRRTAFIANTFIHRDVAMGLLRDDAGDRSYVQRFANAERLSLLASDVIDDWAVRNAPDGVGRLYAAYTSDDRWLVVTVPHSSHDELDRVRVFFGPSEHVRERELFVFARPRGPTSVEVFFDLEGERVKASFPVDCGPERYRPDCPGTLVRATEQPSLTQLSHGTPVPEHLRFVCVRPRSES